jgi:RND superfamily putative drug exporter
MLAISRFVLRHKLAVVLFWLAALVAGAAAASGLGARLSQQVTLPGAAGYQVNQRILRLYGNGEPGYPEVVVVTLPAGDSSESAAGRRSLATGFGAVAAPHGLRVADYANTGDQRFSQAILGRASGSCSLCTPASPRPAYRRRSLPQCCLRCQSAPGSE